MLQLSSILCSFVNVQVHHMQKVLRITAYSRSSVLVHRKWPYVEITYTQEKIECWPCMSGKEHYDTKSC